MSDYTSARGLDTIDGSANDFLTADFTRSTGYFGGGAGGVDNGMAATDLAVALPPNGKFAWEAYLPYDASTAGDALAGLVAPSGATGHWGLHGIIQSVTVSSGDIDGFRMAGYGTGNAFGIGGSGGASTARLHGYLATSSTPGDFTLWAGRINNSGTLTVKAGAWLRVTRLA